MMNELPNLPGYKDNFVVKDNYAKNHIFDVVDGVDVVGDKNDFDSHPSTQETIPRTEVFHHFKRNISPNTEKVSLTNSVKPVVLTTAPKWLAYYKCVLRFYAYTTERVLFSTDEKTRLRKFTLYYYLEDDTIFVSEDKTENAGMAQGVFVGRCRIPKCDEDRYLNWTDIKVGKVLNIHGTKFNIAQCDNKTRTFYAKHKHDQAENDEMPKENRKSLEKVQHTRDNTISEYVEAKLGARLQWQLKAERQYLSNDQQILRFWALWKDPKLYGRPHKYTVCYFLADDTIAITEIFEPNSGCMDMPTFLKRSKLPKSIPDHGIALIGKDHTDIVDCYQAKDLGVGKYVEVYGRYILLTSCDDFTKDYYMTNYGREAKEFIPIKEDSPKKKKEEKVVPTLWVPRIGSEADSLGSTKHLIPRPPKKDYIKFMKYDKNVLRFLAELDSKDELDKDRRFVIEFYRADDTVQVYERRRPNSGFVGGKFFERRSVKNPKTGKIFKPQEFWIGGTVVINSYRYHLIEAEEHTLKHFENEPQLFKFADKETLLRRLASKLNDHRFNRTKTFRIIDTNHDVKIDQDEFRVMVERYGWTLNDHECLTLWRHFDLNNNGDITQAEFFSVLDKYANNNYRTSICQKQLQKEVQQDLQKK